MNTLYDHTIIYDNECPMCQAYTKVFIKTGMLDKKGREAFGLMSDNLYNIDLQRACNEIALVNRNDNTVTYGIESLFKIFGHSFPFLRRLFKRKAFKLTMARIYFFISYNRKVIVPGKFFESENSCTPSLNIKYRIAYLVFTWICTAIILHAYSELLTDLIPAGSFKRELLICGGQIVFQAAIVACFNKERLIHYLGNLMTVSFGGAILLLPILLTQNYFGGSLLLLVYFMIVGSLMFLEHMRRVKILELPIMISLSWVLYRLIVLTFIIDI